MTITIVFDISSKIGIKIAWNMDLKGLGVDFWVEGSWR